MKLLPAAILASAICILIGWYLGRLQRAEEVPEWDEPGGGW